MKNTKKVLASAVGAALLSASAILPTAQAEISASVGIANMYLWRGFDLGAGDGDAAVSGDLSVSNAQGFYAGVWGSSGDAVAGTEYDLYAGWGGDVGPVSLDISYWSYLYPSSDVGFNDLSEAIVSVGYGPVTASWYENLEGADNYRYYTLGAEVGKFSGLIGMHDDDTSESPTHLDLTYSYNDNLSFTVSKFIADEPVDDNAKFVVSYSLPIN